jgi:pyrroline-5-carboxylate reductase
MVPNTPVEVRRGVSVYAPFADREHYTIDHDLERDVIALFERLGTVVTMDESLLGAALGVSSVGPAYQALLLEAQVDAAVRHGVKPAVAAQLVAETMSGTAELLRTRAYDTLTVRREVTSPGGSTARGLDALERGGIRAAFSDAMDRVLEVAS